MFNFFRKGKNKKFVGTILEEKPERSIFASDEPMLEDNDGTLWPLNDSKPKRREIDIDLFRKVKRALVLKRGRKFYATEADVARKFRVSTTTIMLIRRARSLKHYKELRRSMSKPERYS